MSENYVNNIYIYIEQEQRSEQASFPDQSCAAYSELSAHSLLQIGTCRKAKLGSTIWPPLTNFAKSSTSNLTCWPVTVSAFERDGSPSMFQHVHANKQGQPVWQNSQAHRQEQPNDIYRTRAKRLRAVAERPSLASPQSEFPSATNANENSCVPLRASLVKE